MTALTRQALNSKSTPASRLAAGAILALLGFGAKCDGLQGEKFTLEESQCKTRQAQVSVEAAGMRHLCGCAEAAGVTPNGSAFTCTVSAGTTVFFHFHSATRKSRIRSLGTPEFVGSPWYDPSDDAPAKVYPTLFGTAGTYQFEDEGFTPVFGQIVAN